MTALGFRHSFIGLAGMSLEASRQAKNACLTDIFLKKQNKKY
jgi:hypothetical protein